MKRLIYSLMLCFGIIVFSACEGDTSQDHSVLTYYASFEMAGDEFTIVSLGTSYVEEGVTAEINGEDVTSSIVVTGEVDETKAGMYYITYSVTNKDGFTTSTTRTVAVCDPTITENMEGDYLTASGTYRMSGETRTDYSGQSVTITYMAPGIFYVSDILGGYYDQRAGYGSSYAMTGYFQLFSDNHIEIISGDVAGWGDSYSDFQNGQYDSTTGIISYMVEYADMEFYVTLEL